MKVIKVFILANIARTLNGPRAKSPVILSSVPHLGSLELASDQPYIRAAERLQPKAERGTLRTPRPSRNTSFFPVRRDAVYERCCHHCERRCGKGARKASSISRKPREPCCSPTRLFSKTTGRLGQYCGLSMRHLGLQSSTLIAIPCERCFATCRAPLERVSFSNVMVKLFFFTFQQ